LGTPEARIRLDAETFGFDLTRIPIIDLTPAPDFFAKAKTYDIFSPADVEREPITHKITEQIEKQKPQRVFVDAITQFRYLASDPQQFHRQTLAFLHYLNDKQSTVLFTSEYSDDPFVSTVTQRALAACLTAPAFDTHLKALTAALARRAHALDRTLGAHQPCGRGRARVG